MAIHTRVVTPITTQGFRSPEDATQLESDGVKVDCGNIEIGRSRSSATARSCCRSRA
jgi:hypothetical protein